MELLHEEGFVPLKVQYIDGTKIESVANKHTFVWHGPVEKYDAKLKAKTEVLLKQIEQSHSIETQENPAADEHSVEEVVNRVERIKNKVRKENISREERKVIKQIIGHQYFPNECCLNTPIFAQ